MSVSPLAKSRWPHARVMWWLLPHVGYYCDGTPEWRWYMGPARWLWRALGRLPKSNMYRRSLG